MTRALSQEQVDVDFAEICRRNRPMLVRYALSMNLDWHDAEDAVQQAFVRLLENLDERGAIGDPIALLTTIIRYEVLSLREQYSRRPKACSPDVLAATVADRDSGQDVMDRGFPCLADMSDPAYAARLELALSAVGPRRRRFIELWCLEGWAWARIAAAMNTTEKAAQDLAYGALKAVQDGRAVVERGTPADHRAEVRALIDRGDLFGQLSADDQEILLMRYVEGLSVAAAAHRLGLRKWQARDRGFKARNTLRTLAQPEGDETS